MKKARIMTKNLHDRMRQTANGILIVKHIDGNCLPRVQKLALAASPWDPKPARRLIQLLPASLASTNHKVAAQERCLQRRGSWSKVGI